MSLQEILQRYETDGDEPDERPLEERHDELAGNIVWLARRLKELKEETKLVKLQGDILMHKLINLRRNEREEANKRQLSLPGARDYRR